MKKLISYFIKYSVSVNIIIIAFLIFGFIGMRSLKSSFFPLVPSKLINVKVAYPGASPQEIEEGVVQKIEENLIGLVGIDRVTSVSSENSATVKVEIEKGYDIDLILADVKNAVDRVPSFPTGMEPVVVSKVETKEESISFVLSGEDVSLRNLKQIAREVEADLRAIDGISQISLEGFPSEEIEIAVREADLRGYNLTFNDVARAVSGANILVTGGNIKTSSEEYLIRASNRAYHGEELDHLIVRADANGNIVRLKDVAEVRDRWSENPDRTFYNGDPAIRISISSTNSEDLIYAADQTIEYIDEFNESHDNVTLNVTRDSSITLKQRTALLTENGAIGMLLVFIFLSLFLKPRLAFWVAFGLPVSFLGMFMLVGYFGVTINVLSLFGMIIVIGILVDDGIVIAENIYHHVEMGKSPIQAAIDGTMEVIPPIVSAILTTVIAFSTFFFLDSRVGDFFGEVSVVVILTLLISLLEALVILPAHIAHSKAVTDRQKTYSFNRWAEKVMSWMRDTLYAPTLKFFLENKFFGFSVFAMLLMLTFGGIGGGIIKSTFFPSIASDRVAITLKMPQGTNVNITDSIISNIEEAAWKVNDEFTQRQTGKKQVVENIIKRIGPGTSNAKLIVNLLPGEERDFSSPEIANSIREASGKVYGAESLVFGSGSSFGGKPVSVSLQGNNILELKQAKAKLKRELRKIAQLKDVSDNDPAGIKEIRLKLKDDAYLLGLTLNEVMRQVRSGFFGFQVQRFQRGRDEIKVWVRYDRKNRSSIKNLDDMRIVTPTGNRVPLIEIAEYEIKRGEVLINHLNGKREIKVEADMKDPGESATDILAVIKDSIMSDILAQYPTVTTLYEGQNREASKFKKSAGVVFPVILVLIYVVIAFTFRAYSQPLLLLLMVPFSLIGVGWGHWIHGLPINILSMLGIIALIGIMVNDGLVLIEKFNGYLRTGMDFEKALYEAGRSRFRAIFLTTITTVAGLAPLIFETSRQAQFLIPMAVSIAYGIIIATVQTLILLPLLLSVTNKLKVNIQWIIKGERPPRETVERAWKETKLLANGEDEKVIVKEEVK